MIRVILCDDHAVVRRGIRDTLSEAVDIKVVAEAGSYSEVREALRVNPCEVLVLDLNLPGRGGLEVLATLREVDSPVKVLIVSMFPEDQYALRCLRAGAQGYLNKAGDPSEFGAMLFSCVGRGARLYGETDHDSALLKSVVGDIPVGGFFCNGEIGPVGGRTYLHGYTSSIGVFSPRTGHPKNIASVPS